jgi:gliding motility-associated-like protein
MKKIFTVFAFLSLFASASAQSPTCNLTAINSAMLAGGYIPLNVQNQPCSRYYYNNNPTTNWNTASNQAAAVGGYLVSINDANENANVLAAAQAQGFSGGIWIGFSDSGVEGNWVWTNGSSNSYTNWNGGEPSNSGGFPCYTDEDGAIMQLSNGFWNDLALNNGCPGAAQFRSVIEIDLCPVVNITTPVQPVCSNQPVQLSAAATLGSPTYNYTWLNISTSAPAGSGAVATVTPPSTTSYAVTAVDRYGCSAIDTVQLVTQFCNPVTCNLAAIDAAVASANFLFLNVQNQPCSRYYYNPNATSNWNTASNQAAAIGATLLTVTSAAENAAVLAAAQAQGLTGGVWIGFTDIAQEGNWVWQDGSPVTYTNWNNSEPSNTTDICSGSGEDAAILQLSNGRWNDVYVNPGFPCLAPAQYRSIVKINLCPVVTANANPSNVCAGQSVALSASTQFGSPTYTYNWTNTTNSTTVATTANTTVTPTATTNFQVTSTDRYGCQATNFVIVTTNNPNVSIVPPASLSCIDTTVTLTASSTSTGATYNWGGGNTSSNYTVNTPGNYTVTVTASGCTATASATVSQNNTAPTFTISPSTPLLTCVANSVTLSGNPSGGSVSYNWGGGNTADSIVVSTPGTITVTATESLSGCTASASTTVTANTTPPNVSIAPPANLNCNNATVSLVASSTTSGTTYNWGGGITTATNSVSAAGTYTVTATDPTNGCSATSSATVNSTPLPSVVINSLSAPSCVDSCNASLEAVATSGAGNYTYVWNNSSTTAIATGFCAGTPSVTVTDSDNCSATSSFTVINPEPATLSIVPADTTVFEGNSVLLTPVFGPYPNSAIASYTWLPATGLSCTDCAAPTFTGGDTLNNYTLSVIYNGNCPVSATAVIRVEPVAGISVPNAFTPNGDGRNDTYNIIAKNIAQFEMRIYNRWGQLVYQTNDIQQGWDGVFNNIAQPAGTYICYFTATKANNEVVKQQVSFTLLR